MLKIKSLRGAHFGPVDLEVGAGECIGVRGPSGSGKSLLLRAIADLDSSEGAVSWKGRSRDSMPAPAWRRMVGLVPAESGWWADRVGAHFDGIEGLGRLLSAVGLDATTLDWEVTRLSTGEKHRLAIVRALALRPEVLLLDEPTAALDREATEKVERLIREELARGSAVVMVTHDPEQAERLAARTFMMEAGRLSLLQAGAA